MDEDEEQEIVLCAVEVIITEMEDFLPRLHWERTNCRHHGNQDRAVRTARAYAGAARELIQRTLYFPYLSAQDQDLIVRATDEILSDSMTGTSLDEILARKSTTESLVVFYIRSGSDAVQDMRNEVIEPVVKYVLSKDLTKLVLRINVVSLLNGKV
ncbi:Aste57867_17990 [Aphanomyces stellatus]|uniref:Aste57867_17990 protein n=1 Tax=Aphanomyces stellatus TaxID=120398 RepID=A0A485L957_9STRA|nr:hypothetical protein As57867_017928 [Aphanomyces stellatus]VFT94729.1 Aste57867_17990 [Aphanomyces stellatus]